ncbi:UDP-glucose 4-epimerase family protein [Burkholderia stagnalis]|uniref:UDP-glucose 4-epimerase family protein n=1 Tax=Burkholderia stagnalis TaxID=1503054 RepID=UPI00075E70FB|nr:SDR family oxidoreductase [Burkholderia stagnalis]KVO55714.1 NAD-dependent dehydratase [Burkholderia stagnalis]KVP16344.1 NAD-dependent dehydratase [Burkholderia stagnalis]KVW94417.1 NAD-dependent dehydratase [Burkholderia stagnalis]KWH78073.1 NAD-dependent dehydratase [Burkholderia stagnalis]KWK19230.1 NAD-dependent dehydratase [Burkholderia stagnalis]
MSDVLVTGANGFVGRALCLALRRQGHVANGLVRHAGGCVAGVHEWIHPRDNFANLTDAWPARLAPDCVVHLAARVHVMRDDANDPSFAFREANVDGALRVAEAAHRRNVRRMVFVSSVKAMAESDGGAPLSEDVPPHPEDAYGRSKLEAERALVEFASRTGLDLVIVRPPLVYGPDVRANFLRMMDAIARGMPLPLGAIGARRSLVYVENLTDALVRCVTDPRASRGCFHVADDNAPSVTELLRMVGDALGKPARLFPVPVGVLRTVGKLTGRSAAIDRLTGSLQLDTSLIRHVLDWQPPYSTRQGLEATAAWYRSRDTRQ